MTTIGSSLSSITGARDYSSETLDNTVANNKDLGQEDFLTLMTTQLQNQDPFAPMENGDFLAQMAQFSSVAGLDKINETLTAMSEEMASSQISTASSLLGQHVLVTGSTARPDQNGEIHGSISLDETASEVTITYTDASNNVLYRDKLGSKAAGDYDFSWTDVPASIQDANSSVRVTVDVETDDGSSTVFPQLYAKVIGVQMPTDGGDMTLNVQDYGERNYLEISALR